MSGGRRLQLPVRPSAALAVLAALTLVGCAGERAAAAPAVEPARVFGGTLRLVQEAPRSLDPLESASVYESMPINQLFDTLVEFDPSLNVRPALAESWRVSPDGLDYLFTLRPGVRFHDGSTVTAADVSYSIRRQIEPGRSGMSLAAPYLEVIAGAEAFLRGAAERVEGLETIDPRTLRIRLARPYPSFLMVLTMDSLSVVPERILREQGAAAFARHPIGTGPFRLAGWSDRKLRLVANPDYYRGRPWLDGVEVGFLSADETDSGLSRYMHGEIDVLEPPATGIESLQADPKTRVHRYQELSLSFLGLNTRRPPFDDLRVRRAIAMAIDRDALVAGMPAVRRKAVGILPPGFPGFSPLPKTLGHDPEGARRLLAEAGHPGGEGLPPIRLDSASRGESAARLVARIRADLAEVGLRLEVVEVSWTRLTELLESRRADAFLLGWVAELSDPDAFLRGLFDENGPGNYFGYRSEAAQELFARGIGERNPIERSRIYREIERLVLDSAPVIPLYHTVGVVALDEHVNGLVPSPLGLAKAELERVWLSDRGGAT